MNSAKRSFGLALFVALLFPLSAQTQTPPAPNPATAERFLVIVETSAAMQKRAENVQKALGSVIASGLQGQIGEDCTVGVWTFNEKLFTGQLPLQLWNSTTRQKVALTVVQFLQQQKNEKPGRLAAAWEAATNVVAQSDRITLLLVTSGADPVVGTPFDAAITESFLKNSDQQRKQNMPFLTILRAVKGKFVAFAVNMPPWPLEVPAYPDGYRPTPPPPAPAVIAETKPTPVVKRPDPGMLSPTNTIYLAETSAPVEVPVATTITPAPTNPAVTATAQPIPKIAVESKPTDTAPVAPANAAAPEPATAPNAKFPVVTILIAGIALLLGVMVVFIALLRWSRRSAGESLITHSMNKDR